MELRVAAKHTLDLLGDASVNALGKNKSEILQVGAVLPAQPQALTANPHQSTPSTLYPSVLLWAARASFVPRLSWTWSTKPWVLPDGECSPWELGQRDHECAAASAEGAVTLMATPHIRQMARKPPVSPEKASQPPGFLRVGASPGWAALLQWVQSDPDIC